MKIEKIKENIDKKTGPVAKIVIPIIAAVIVVAAAVAYICLKIADEMRYNEKWKDYDECGMH
ncbi:MAG: hypothetical protein K2J80_13730 [Oscillospiraceae bacterium]|nr:hypothetical protein [Oscillospiraceae bacterium]